MQNEKTFLIVDVDFVLTERCNLSCDYCYIKTKKNRSLSLKTAKKAIDWLLKRPISGTSDFRINFYGGEPLLEFQLIKDIFYYAKNKTLNTKRKITFSITTNGLLFDDKVAEFWKENNFCTLLSCDGKKIAHDLHRKMADGNGSFDAISSNIKLILDSSINKEVRMTVTPQTIEKIVESVQYFKEVGFKRIDVFYDGLSSWKKDELLIAEEQFYLLGDYYIEQFFSGNYTEIPLFENRIPSQLLKNNYEEKKDASCGAGKVKIAIGCDGTIYPCQMFATTINDADKFSIGNVFTGFDEEKRKFFTEITQSDLIGCDISCDKCKYFNGCISGCMAINNLTTKNLFRCTPQTRYFEIIFSDVADSIAKKIEGAVFSK